MSQQENPDSIPFTKIIDDITEEYTKALKDLSDFSDILIQKLETTANEMKESKKLVDEMEQRILRHSMYHPAGFVNRIYFDFFMQTENKRKATDEEWDAFVKTFTFNTNPFRSAIYGWIDGWEKNSEKE
jgi:hypothetical protein